MARQDNQWNPTQVSYTLEKYVGLKRGIGGRRKKELEKERGVRKKDGVGKEYRWKEAVKKKEREEAGGWWKR